LGGTLGDTKYFCTDYSSSSQKIIVGGTSYSTDMVSSSPTPILVSYSSTTGAIAWSN
jgi:hypothetical protein